MLIHIKSCTMVKIKFFCFYFSYNVIVFHSCCCCYLPIFHNVLISISRSFNLATNVDLLLDAEDLQSGQMRSAMLLAGWISLLLQMRLLLCVCVTLSVYISLDDNSKRDFVSFQPFLSRMSRLRCWIFLHKKESIN